MKVENLYNKYGIDKYILNEIVVCMMSKKDLFMTKVHLETNLTHEQIFAIAKFYCEDEFGVSFDEMAPQWILDRYKIQEERKDEVLEIIEKSKELKRIKKIEEDLYYLMEEKKIKENRH